MFLSLGEDYMGQTQTGQEGNSQLFVCVLVVRLTEGCAMPCLLLAVTVSIHIPYV